MCLLILNVSPCKGGGGRDLVLEVHVASPLRAQKNNTPNQSCLKNLHPCSSQAR